MDIVQSAGLFPITDSLKNTALSWVRGLWSVLFVNLQAQTLIC